MRASHRGFTLIELLVVISIIGILASIVLGSLGDARTKAKIAREFAQLKQVQTALELYANANGGTYPGTDDTWYDSDCSSNYFGGDDYLDMKPLLAGYMNVPSDQTTGQCIWYAKAPTSASDPDVIGTWKYILLLDSTDTINFGTGQGCYSGYYCAGMK